MNIKEKIDNVSVIKVVGYAIVFIFSMFFITIGMFNLNNYLQWGSFVTFSFMIIAFSIAFVVAGVGSFVVYRIKE